MKIALSARNFIPPFIGGVDIFADRLGRALERTGNEVFYLAFNSSADHNSSVQIREDNDNGRRVWRLLFDFKQRPPEYYQLGYDPAMRPQISSILDNEKPDLIIILNFYMSTLALVESAKNLDIPIVHIATDYLPICRRATMIRWNGKSCKAGETIQSCSECFVAHKISGRLAAFFLNFLSPNTLTSLARKKDSGLTFSPLKALNPYWRQILLMERRFETMNPLRNEIDLILAPTQYTAQLFRENGFSRKQVQFLPYGVEIDDPLGKVEHKISDHIRFLFVGRLQPYKGAHIMVKAFNQLVSPRYASLTIYGIWDGFDRYHDELNALINTNDRIHFKGKISHNELGKAFAETDYFILPSIWHENLPFTLLEALQSHTPVISSDIGGVTDVVKNNVNGFLFPMGNVSALKQVMQHVIDHPDLVNQLRNHSELLSIDDYVLELLSGCKERGLLKERIAIRK